MAESYELKLPVELVEALSAFTCTVNKQGKAEYEGRDRIWLDDGYLVACNGISAIAYPILPEGDKRILGIPSGILDACKVARKANKIFLADLALQVTPHDLGPDATAVVEVPGKDGSLSRFQLICKREGCPPWGRKMAQVGKGKRVWFGLGRQNLESLLHGVQASGAIAVHLGVPLIPTEGGWWEGVDPTGGRGGFQKNMIAVRAVAGGRTGVPVSAGWSGAVAAFLVSGVDGIDPGHLAMCDPCPIWQGNMLDEEATPAVTLPLPEVPPCAEPAPSPLPPAAPSPKTAPVSPALLKDLLESWEKSAELREIVRCALAQLRQQKQL